MTLLILIILLSIYYAFFKNNEVEVNIEKSKFFVQQRFKNIDLEEIPLNLKIDVEKILKDTETIELKKEWSSELDFDISMKPFFDLDNLYLVTLDKIVAYKKNNFHALWKKQFTSKIIHFNFLDKNKIILGDDSLHFYTINKKTGKTIWYSRFSDMKLPALNQNLNPIFISNLEDQRLNNSVLIVPQKNSLNIINVENGKLISKIQLDSEILYISDYDLFNNSLYVFTKSTLIKFKLENSRIKPII